MTTITSSAHGPRASCITLAMLFAGSFGLTLWWLRPSGPPAIPAISDAGQIAQAAPSALVAAVPAHVAAELAAPALDEDAPPAAPSPSLQELATANDPALREEAQALLGVIISEPVLD